MLFISHLFRLILLLIFYRWKITTQICKTFFFNSDLVYKSANLNVSNVLQIKCHLKSFHKTFHRACIIFKIKLVFKLNVMNTFFPCLCYGKFNTRFKKKIAQFKIYERFKLDNI